MPLWTTEEGKIITDENGAPIKINADPGDAYKTGYKATSVCIARRHSLTMTLLHHHRRIGFWE